jgi:hypothetical protein
MVRVSKRYSLETAEDLVALCNEFGPDIFPKEACSFLEFGLQTHRFALGSFRFETGSYPPVLFRESQSLIVGYAEGKTDSAILMWEFDPTNPFRFAPDNIRDLVISLVLDFWTLTGDMMFDVDFDEYADVPDEAELEILWRGQSIAGEAGLSMCALGSGRLWFEIPGRGVFSLGAHPAEEA